MKNLPVYILTNETRCLKNQIVLWHIKWNVNFGAVIIYRFLCDTYCNTQKAFYRKSNKKTCNIYKLQYLITKLILWFKKFKLFNMISILKYVCRLNLHFFLKLLVFIKYFTKLLFLDNFGSLKNNNYVKYLINNKKIQKNIKFDVQAHFNIDIVLNGLDRLFEFWKFQN